jgi:glucose/arabinose dehydrogenase
MRTLIAAPMALFTIIALGGSATAQMVSPGEEIRIDPSALPAPGVTASAANPPEYEVRPEGSTITVPAGFAVNVFAKDFDNPRWLQIAPNGDVFVSSAGKITVLRDADGDGTAETRSTFVSGLNSLHGMAFRPGSFYVADTEGVWRMNYRDGQLHAEGQKVEVTPPGAFGTPGGHSSRTLVFHPNGDRFYVGIGSASNIAEEAAPRASVQEFRADGSGQRTFAAGLRNPVGLAFRPGTTELWTVVNERDGLGEELVPDYLTHLEDSGFYGWPYSYIGAHPQPDFAERRPDLVRRAIVPDLLFRSHSAPLGLVFYDGGSFPAEYRGDAFVSLHGSWNAAEPRGYCVVRVPFKNGRPAGGYEVFASGFVKEVARRTFFDQLRSVVTSGFARSALKRLTNLSGDQTPAIVWGRPVGLAVGKDGSLLIADDSAGVIWRVIYHRK